MKFPAARGERSGGQNDFDTTLAKATGTDKNQVSDNATRNKAAAESKHGDATSRKRDAAEEASSDGSAQALSSTEEVIEDVDVAASGESTATNEADSSGAMTESGEAQVSPRDAQVTAQDSTESSSQWNGGDAKPHASVAAVQMGLSAAELDVGAIGVTLGGARVAATAPVVEVSAEIGAKPQAAGGALLNEIDTASVKAAPADVDAGEHEQLRAAAVLLRDQQSAGKQTVDVPAQVTADVRPELNATKAATQPQSAAVVAHAQQPVPTHAKAKSLVEVKSVASEIATSTATPAAARAAQVESAVRLENALAMMSGTSDGETSLRISTPSATAANTNSRFPDGQVAGQTLSQQLATFTNTDDAQFTGQMTRGLAAMMNQRGGVMTMRLNPPELGEVRVQMTLSRGVVSAEFHATTSQAHALLDRNLTVLRNALEGQGLTVDRLNVHAPPGTAPGTGHSMLRDESGGSWNQQGASQQRSDHDAGHGESRGRHEHAGDGQQRWIGEADFTEFFEDFEATFSTLEPRNAP